MQIPRDCTAREVEPHFSASLSRAPVVTILRKKKLEGKKKRDIFTPRLSAFFIPVANKEQQ
jgi:hypothetical protein